LKKIVATIETILENSVVEKDYIIAQKDETISLLQERVAITERKLTDILLEMEELKDYKQVLTTQLNHAQSRTDDLVVSSKADIDGIQSKLDEAIRENDNLNLIIVERDAMISELPTALETSNISLKKCQSDNEELTNSKHSLELNLGQCERELLLKDKGLREADAKVVKVASTISKLTMELKKFFGINQFISSFRNYPQ
jgi:chromosome segregation ATPase